MINSLVQQTSTTTTVTEQEFVNPLPKDKFVFLEIKEQIQTKVIYSRPLYEIIPPSYYDYEKRILYIRNEENIPTGGVFLMIFHYTSLHHPLLHWTYNISNLPFTVEVPKNLFLLGIKKEDWFRNSLVIKDITGDGNVEFEYIQNNKKEKIILGKGKSWNKRIKKKIWSPTIKYSGKTVYRFHKFQVNLQIINYGILEKSNDVNINAFGKKYKWDSKRKEYIRKEENQP